jgi:hypothetical protein
VIKKSWHQKRQKHQKNKTIVFVKNPKMKVLGFFIGQILSILSI